jgi:hypothetical protein
MARWWKSTWSLSSDVPKRKKYSANKEVRRLARERVGSPPAPKVIVPKTERKKPKHKKPPGFEELG